MRHRQTTGAGPSGTRPSIVIFLLTAAGGGLAVGLDQPAGPWAGYGSTTIAALVGCGTLWQQRGVLERRAKEMARRRRADLAAAATVDRQRRSELERLRTELEHEQQYSTLIQDQLTRAREQVERERAARRAAEREVDALTGADSWQAGSPPVLLTVEEPGVGATSVVEAEDLPTGAPTELPAEETQTAARSTKARPSAAEPIPARLSVGASEAQRRGWQVLDGEAGDGDDREDGIEADRLYRPFIDHLAAAAVPVSDAALAMAPVIGAADLDGILDLTAYDETVEFSVRELNKGTA